MADIKMERFLQDVSNNVGYPVVVTTPPDEPWERLVSLDMGEKGHRQVVPIGYLQWGMVIHYPIPSGFLWIRPLQSKL